MPFKLKLKKSRHYSVVSKSLFVNSVELLDGTNIECTLSSETTGKECLDIVCQKLGLNQPQFFGLQYLSRARDNVLCWVELDNPIKRQLDKYARGSYVYLRVMYYVVSGVRLFNDEVTRNHYFLQLKMDVIEGKINCSPQQAVELASFCMQAEFGNFDAERHTAHYLKDFQLFPKSFTDTVFLETLTNAASRQHVTLHNIPQGTAEEYYICACQRLEGYGQEVYSVKDVSNEEALLGVSLTGVAVMYHSGREGRNYRWADISNVINHKRDFTIESVMSSEKAEFHFADAEQARNAWRFCVLQHMFYRQYENNADQTDRPAAPNFRTSAEQKPRPMDSYEDIASYDQHSNSTHSMSQRAQSTSCLDLNTPTDIDKLRSLLPSYRPAPDYETAVQQKYRNSAGGALQNQHRNVIYSSQPEIHQLDSYAAHLRYPDVTHNNIEQKNMLGNHYNPNLHMLSNENQHNLQDMADKMRMLHLTKPPPPYPANRISFNSTPDLAGLSQISKPQPTIVNSIVSGSSPDLVSTGNFLNHQYLKQYGLMYGNNQVHRSQSYLQSQHGTYENLASIFNNNMLGRPQAVIVENPNITKHIKKVYDEHGNIIYCMPANMKQILEDNQISSTGFVVTRNQATRVDVNNSNEPIYENIPLPWQNDGQMRARTQSIQSAPEVSQVVNHVLVNARTNNESKETLYANIKSSNTELNRSSQNVNKSPEKRSESPTTLSRTNTFIVNKKSPTNSTVLSSPPVNSSLLNSSTTSAQGYVDPANVSNETATTESSNASSGKKKRRWGILMGRSKSSEKVKSATLGREKEKNKDKNQSNNRHRWSTGLPRLHPLPPSISKETMCQLLENKLADSQLFFEFDKIPKKKPNSDFTTASLPENNLFNRFREVLPYEENRFRLTPSRENKTGYINASHITATVGSKQRFYIAGQGPSRTTLPYFWQCIWEAEVYLIVQLTDLTEDLNYLPDANERCLNIGTDYQIWWEFSQTHGHCITSKIRLCHVTSRRYRTLWHLHYTDWGDNGCPIAVAHFLGFLEELQSVQQHSMVEIPPGHNKNPPVFVHCTAGVGRTGLAVLCDLLLYTVDHNQLKFRGSLNRCWHRSKANMTEDSGPSTAVESCSKAETAGDTLSSQRVFKKSSPNNKLTLYLSSRDLVVSSGKIDRLQGVLLVDPEFIEDRKVYGQITLTFRYGREDEEVMGLKFCNEAVMCLTQLYPPPTPQQTDLPSSITPLQEALMKRLGSNAYPFNMEITPLAPPSVQLVPAKEYSGAPIGTSYDVRAYIAEKADEKLHRRTTVRMGIRVVQRAFAPPSPLNYNALIQNVNKDRNKHKISLFGCKSAPLDSNKLFEMSMQQQTISKSVETGLENKEINEKDTLEKEAMDAVENNVEASRSPIKVTFREEGGDNDDVTRNVVEADAEEEVDDTTQKNDDNCDNENSQIEQIKTAGGGRRMSLAAFLAEIPAPHASTEKPFLLSDGKIELEASLNNAVYHHGEELQVTVHIRNSSNKTIRRIKVFIVQHVDVCMFSNGKFKNVVAMINSKENCPVNAGKSLTTTFTLLPIKSSTKNWIALEDSYTKTGSSLASSVTSSTNSPDERNVFAIYVSYYVKVKLILSVMGGDVSLKLPFTLMHTCNDYDPNATLTRLVDAVPCPSQSPQLKEEVKPEKDGT